MYTGPVLYCATLDENTGLADQSGLGSVVAHDNLHSANKPDLPGWIIPIKDLTPLDANPVFGQIQNPAMAGIYSYTVMYYLSMNVDNGYEQYMDTVTWRGMLILYISIIS